MTDIRRARAEDGFTAVELPIVVSLVSILIGILVPAVQTIREPASRSCPSPAPLETEPVDIRGELNAITIVDTATETFSYEVNSKGNVVGVGLGTGNKWRLVGSANGKASLDQPVQLLHGFRLVGSSETVAGETVPVELRTFFTFDKDSKVTDVSILEAEAEDPC